VTDIGLWAIAANDPERTAVIDPRGAAISYAELAALADRYARGLQEPRPHGLGLRPGDCVAGMLPNSTEALALFFAAIETGLYVVPVNWHLAAAEVAYILADSGVHSVRLSTHRRNTTTDRDCFFTSLRSHCRNVYQNPEVPSSSWMVPGVLWS